MRAMYLDQRPPAEVAQAYGVSERYVVRVWRRESRAALHATAGLPRRSKEGASPYTGRRTIDPQQAAAWMKVGYSCREIGVIIAGLHGRATPYTPKAVSRAAAKAQP